MDITVKNKFTFSGHESFQCRELWLKKGYDYVLQNKSFSDEDAVVKLGVGKNMVAAIRYWLRAFNIIDLKDKPTQFATRLLDTDEGYDPFLEDEGSLWLLHYQLVKNGFASIFTIVFNEFRKEKFSFNKETFINYLKRKSEQESGIAFNEKTLSTDFTVFLKMYQRTQINRRDIEDSFSGILSEIELLTTLKNGKEEFFQIENKERNKLPEAIFLFSILDNPQYGNSISLNALENDINSPGAIFAMNRSGLLDKITDIASADKKITFTDHAGLKELQFKVKPDPYTILDTYYGK